MPTPPNVPLLKALWPSLDGDTSRGSWGVLVQICLVKRNWSNKSDPGVRRMLLLAWSPLFFAARDQEIVSMLSVARAHGPQSKAHLHVHTHM